MEGPATIALQLPTLPNNDNLIYALRVNHTFTLLNSIIHTTVTLSLKLLRFWCRGFLVRTCLAHRPSAKPMHQYTCAPSTDTITFSFTQLHLQWCLRFRILNESQQISQSDISEKLRPYFVAAFVLMAIGSTVISALTQMLPKAHPPWSLTANQLKRPISANQRQAKWVSFLPLSLLSLLSRPCSRFCDHAYLNAAQAERR